MGVSLVRSNKEGTNDWMGPRESSSVEAGCCLILGSIGYYNFDITRENQKIQKDTI
jgi:hypothetical protein